MPVDKKVPPWGVGHYWKDRTGKFLGQAQASLNRLPSLRVDWSRQRDEAGSGLGKRLSRGVDYTRHVDDPRGEYRAEIWRLGSLSIEQTKDWGCAALSALYVLMATVAIVTPLIFLSQPQQEHKPLAGAAVVQMSSIIAIFAAPNTFYDVQLAGADVALFQFDWANSNHCGRFSWIGPKATWNHPNSLGCTGDVHDGVISVSAVGDQYTCKATYTAGSAPGSGQPASCEGKRASIGQSTAPEWTRTALWIGAPLGAVILLGFGGWFLSPHGPPAALARRRLVPTSRSGASGDVDPCAAEKAYVAELEARIAKRDAELGPSVKRGDTYLPPALRDTIAKDNDLLAKARARLALCLGASAPGDAPGPVTPAPTGSTPVTPKASGPDVHTGAGAGGVAPHPTTFSPPDPPPPIPQPPALPPEKPTLCTEGETKQAEIKCQVQGDLWFFNLARVEIDGASMFGEGTVEDALKGLDTFLTGIDVATGLIGAVTSPVESILGTAGLSPDNITTVPRDAVMKGLDKTAHAINRLKRWGRWKVRIPHATCQFSCTWQEVCRNGNWAVEKSTHMKPIGQSAFTDFERDVNGDFEARRFIAYLTGQVTQRNSATNALFDGCERQCR
jgi:hypothetical protein